jgi:hypothetical protein
MVQMVREGSGGGEPPNSSDFMAEFGVFPAPSISYPSIIISIHPFHPSIPSYEKVFL